MIWFIFGFILGAIVSGYVVKNNKDKAFSILDEAKTQAEKELAKIKLIIKANTTK